MAGQADRSPHVSEKQFRAVGARTTMPSSRETGCVTQRDTDWTTILEAVEAIEKGISAESGWIPTSNNRPALRDLLGRVSDIAHASSERYIHERVDLVSGCVAKLFDPRVGRIEGNKRKIREVCRQLRAHHLRHESR